MSQLATDTSPAAIRPFRAEVPEAALADLRRRLAATRWPDKETVVDRSQGVQLAKLQELVRYWGKERAAIEDLRAYLQNGGLAYLVMMGARPQAVGYGLTDSLAGLAAWMLVHGGFDKWSYGKDPKQSPTRDDVLDNFTLYWLTNTAASSARIYWENRGRSLTSAAAQKTDEIQVPVAITVFPDEVYQLPKTWAERAFRNLIYFNEADRGGHFAAWEHPELSAAELRAAFKSLR